jgi:glucokinase
MIEYIGLDIGGTNIRVGAIDEKERLVCFSSQKTMENVKTANDLYKKIKEMVKGITDYETVKRIGIGYPGAIDKDGNITTSRNIPVFKDFPLKEKIQKDFKTEVVIENDARVAALAEAIKGAGKNSRTICYSTLSTGLGGAIIEDKKIFRGDRNIAGYYSRMMLDTEEIAEHRLSGTSLINLANKEYNLKVSNVQEIFALAKKNDAAKKIVEDFKKYLLALLLNMSITTCPNMIILGGGVMKAKKYFFEEVKEEFKKKAHSFAKDTVITEPKLKEPGVVGACLLAKYE